MNDSDPLVSILIPVYGVEKYIERCARSIFEQTYQNLEIIFVNDCSQDNSVSILTKVIADYPDRRQQTRIIHHEKNQGVAAARNTALLASSGYYIQYLDSDDYADVDMIRQMVILSETKRSDITICDFYYAYNYNNVRCFANASEDPIQCLCQVLRGEIHSGLWNKMIKRSLFFNNQILYINGLNMMEDMSVMYKLMFYASNIAYLKAPLYYYTQGNANSYTKTLSQRARKNVIDLLSYMDCFFKKHAISEIVMSAFDVFKLSSKAMLIVYAGTSKERIKYINLFPEIDYKKYKQDMLLSNYLVLFFSDLGLPMANFISWAKNLLRILKIKYLNRSCN